MNQTRTRSNSHEGKSHKPYACVLPLDLRCGKPDSASTVVTDAHDLSSIDVKTDIFYTLGHTNHGQPTSAPWAPAHERTKPVLANIHPTSKIGSMVQPETQLPPDNADSSVGWHVPHCTGNCKDQNQRGESRPTGRRLGTPTYYPGSSRDPTGRKRAPARPGPLPTGGTPRGQAPGREGRRPGRGGWVVGGRPDTRPRHAGVATYGAVNKVGPSV